jgi:hypothetical protein
MSKKTYTKHLEEQEFDVDVFQKNINRVVFEKCSYWVLINKNTGELLKKWYPIKPEFTTQMGDARAFTTLDEAKEFSKKMGLAKYVDCIQVSGIFVMHEKQFTSGDKLPDWDGIFCEKYCKFCGHELQLVRPGKIQCPKCGMV